MYDKKMISLVKANWKVAISFLMLLPSLAWALGTTTVTVAPNQANNYAQYTIQSSTGSGNNDLEANQDSVIIIFNASTTVPGSINPSLITVNNTTANAVTVIGQRVSILTPVFIRRNSTPITVVINASANIQNPATPASNYTIQFETTKESAVTSQQYTISASSSTITPAAVTPNPSVSGELAAYTIAFDVGSGGALLANESTITIEFPDDTYVPPGAISGVTVNSTSASATASDFTVVITSPVNVSNNGSVNIVFAIGAGLQNPDTPGAYTLDAFTSTETEPISSESYTISSATELSISAITAKPDTVNQADIFELDFRVGNTGALTANVDTITLAFQQNTFLPVDMSPANITVSSGGFSDNAAGIKVLKNVNTDDDTLHIITPINIANSADVTVTLNASSGYLNPSLAGNYSLFLRTSQDETGATSNPYAIFNTTTTVSMATVVPADNTQNTWTDYTINFNLGRLGRLKAGESTITITFDGGYDVSETPGDYSTSQLIVGETDVYDISSLITPNNDPGVKTIQITIPDDAVTDNNDNIELILSGNTPIFNPNDQQNYVLWVKTSVEPSSVASQTYNIGGTTISNLSVTSNNSVNKAAQYDLSFDIYREINVGSGSNPDDYIVVIFPEGTVLPSAIAGAYVSLGGTPKGNDDITINQSTRTVTIPVESRFRPSDNPVTVQFASGANIISPIVPSTTFYKAIVYTSQDENPVTSPAYSITGNNSRVSSVSGTVNPAAISATGVQFTVNFTTSDSGKIAGGRPAGSSTVTIDFDAGTYVPASITPSKVQINSTPCAAVSVLSGDTYGGVVRLTVPNGLIIGNTTAATVVFDTSAGLDNSNTLFTNNLLVTTSSDTLPSDSTGINGDYVLVSSQSLSVTSVTPNPATQNAAAGYSVKFKTGSAGALVAGQTITMEFPNNTFLPASASQNDISVKINSTTYPLTENPVIIDNTLEIEVPSGVSIGNLTDVTVLINQATGILNPTVVGGYILQVSTESETGPFNSPSYNITQTSSTVSAANVTVETPTPTTATAYTIDFTVGTNGRLYAGTSTITVTFNASTTVDQDENNYDNTSITVDGTPTSIPETDITVNGQAVTFLVPSSVSVDNNDNVTLVIDGTTPPISNPTTENSYTLQVRTSVETSNITSNSYYISSVGAVTGITNTLSSYIVNATSANTVAFTLSATAGALSASTGTITITFPNNTLVPSSIATSNIQITSSQPAGSGDASAVVVNAANRRITINMPGTVSADDGATITVAILSGAGIQNASISGDKTLLVHTSSQPVDGTSAAYTLTAATSTITGFSVLIDPNTPSTIAEHTFSFTTGTYGRLLSGTSTITLLIPDDAVFTLGAPAPSKVTINSTQAQAVTLNTGSGTAPDELIITVPSSVTIGNNAGVTVVIDATAGLQTASTTAPLTYTAYTSVENTSVNHDYSLPVQLTTFEAKAQNEIIIISWQTESEFNNVSWRLERKEISDSEFKQYEEGLLDVLSAGTDYALIAEIEGQGTTVDMTNYEFVDNTINAGGIYVYRIADISYNGRITYHGPVVQKADIPVVFSLAQNYPNPFNPTTTIKFTLPVAAKVKIIIYNMLGQEVARLVDNKVLETGWHALQWHGMNRNNDRVASGIYIYRLEAKSVQGNKNYVKSHKMIVLK